MARANDLARLKAMGRKPKKQIPEAPDNRPILFGIDECGNEYQTRVTPMWSPEPPKEDRHE